MKPVVRLLLTALVVETLCVTYALCLPWLLPVAAVLYTVSGIVIAYALLFRNTATPQAVTLLPRRMTAPWRWLVVGAGLVVMCTTALQWMEDEPLDHHTADMLPIIQVMCQRFIAGAWQHVYDPIPHIWNGTVPIYLPAMWLPFSLPELFHIDLRWMTVLLLLVVLILFVKRVDLYRKATPVLYACVFLLFWWLFGVDKAGLVPYTEEGVVIFYYVLLTLVLLRSKENIWLLGLCTSLCVLSRYALAGWLPAMVLYFGLRGEWKNLLRFAFTGILCFLLLALLPFGGGMIHSLFGLPGSYIAFAGRVWNDAPEVFQTSQGWARFFGPQRIAQQHYLLITPAFGVPLVTMLAGWWLHKKYRFPLQHLPLAVFKITLVVFFSLVDVPYLYLFYTSSFVSVFAVAAFVNRLDSPSDKTDDLIDIGPVVA